MAKRVDGTTYIKMIEEFKSQSPETSEAGGSDTPEGTPETPEAPETPETPEGGAEAGEEPKDGPVLGQ